MISKWAALGWTLAKGAAFTAVPSLGFRALFTWLGAAALAFALSGSFVAGWKVHKRWIASAELAQLKQDIATRDEIITQRGTRITNDLDTILQLQAELKGYRDAPDPRDNAICIPSDDKWLRFKSGVQPAAKPRRPLPSPGPSRRSGVAPQTFISAVPSHQQSRQDGN